MAVLHKTEIDRRLGLDIEDHESLVITPLLQMREAIDVDSVDLRLGTYFLLPYSPAQAFFCPDRRSSAFFHTRVHVPLGDYLVVPAHQTVLGATLEYVKLPSDVAGQILTKSSVARTFIVVETAPWVHPGYRGCLTLEIANVSNTPLLLYPGRSIAQLILMRVEPTPTEAEKLDSKYLGPIYPEAAVSEDPEVELMSLGIKSVWVIPERQICEKKR